MTTSSFKTITKADLLTPPTTPANYPKSPLLQPTTIIQERISTPSHLPILFAVLPPLGSLFIGTTETWSDALILLLAGFYLYNLVKIPWELYSDVHFRIPQSINTKDKDQVRAFDTLKSHERYLFALVLLSPLVGGMLLLLLQKTMLTTSSKYLTPNTIMLYVLAASMRPLSHLINRAQSRAERLQVGALFSQDSLKVLLGRLGELEKALTKVQQEMVSKKELDDVKDEFETSIESVARAVRQFARHAEKERKVLDVQLERQEERVRNVEEWCEVQRVQASQSNLLVRAVWEPVQVLKEAVGVSTPRALLGYGARDT